jgi:hypothetical protein
MAEGLQRSGWNVAFLEFFIAPVPQPQFYLPNSSEFRDFGSLSSRSQSLSKPISYLNFEAPCAVCGHQIGAEGYAVLLHYRVERRNDNRLNITRQDDSIGAEQVTCVVS